MQSWILQQPIQMVRHLQTSTWICWSTDKTGCFLFLISVGKRKSSPSLVPVASRWNIYRVYTHSSAVITGPMVSLLGFLGGLPWGCTIKARIKVRNNYSGLCVGEWQQWRAHCQLWRPAVAQAKDLKGWGEWGVGYRGIAHREGHLRSYWLNDLPVTVFSMQAPDSGQTRKSSRAIFLSIQLSNHVYTSIPVYSLSSP